MAELTEELRVLVTAEVDKAIKNLQQVDRQTNDTEKVFKKLGNTITSALSITALMRFTSKTNEAWRIQKEAASVLNTVLESTGATAWTSAEQLEQMASSLQKITNYGDETVQSMQSVLLGFRNIKGDQFESATKAILDMATVMKMDLKSAAQVVGKALDDPINGLDSLRRQGFQFTDAQKQMIKAMLDAGDAAGAQKLILDELETTYGGAAEAAADTATQIKNSLSDVLEGYGKLITTLGTGTGVLGKFRDGLDYVADALKNSDEYFAKVAGGEKYQKWFDSLTDTKKLQEAEKQLASWREKLEKATNPKDIDAATVNVDLWRRQVAFLRQAVSEAQRLQAEENARRDTESEINDLMYSIAQNYGKLSKDDPVKQLEAYQSQLSEIERQRAKLSEKAFDKDGNLIDTKGTLEQLDYIEKKVREKMKALQDDGVKSWRKWLSEITSISEKDFSGGADAARLYLDQMEQEFQRAKSLAELLDDNFDISAQLEKQRDKIRKTLESLLNIDPSQIDEAFSTQDASIQALIDKYRELSKAIDDVAATAPKSWEEQMSEAIENVLLKIDELDAHVAKAFGNMTVQMANISLDAAMSGFEEFGRALGEGEDAADSLQSALAAMAESILNQLPTMFLQAGLQLIAQGQWPLGLGFIAAAGSTAIISGFVSGKKSASEENALGGVYGADDYRAFAKGGTFTNQIVSSPTFFRFAKGSGFGTGLMGEAGPEAIMPLTRGADGSLGVDASGVGNVEVNIPVYVYSDEPVEVNDTTDENGQGKIEVLVGSMINSHIANGKADRAMKSRYGLKVQGV